MIINISNLLILHNSGIDYSRILFLFDFFVYCKSAANSIVTLLFSCYINIFGIIESHPIIVLPMLTWLPMRNPDSGWQTDIYPIEQPSVRQGNRISDWRASSGLLLLVF